MFSQDFVINKDGKFEGGGAHGSLLANSRLDIGMLRPYLNEDDGNRPTVTINSGKKKRIEVKNKQGRTIGFKYQPEFVEVRIKDLIDTGMQLSPITTNATTLSKEQWIRFDAATIPPQRERLYLYDDVARMKTYSFPGLGVKMLEEETINDEGRAYMDMDGLSEDTNDNTLYQLEGTPIPVIHSGFSIDLRTLESSRLRGTPLSTTKIERATRRCLEMREFAAIGINNPLLWGTATQVSGYGRTPGNYGLLNFPSRMTKTDLTAPTGSNPEAVIQDILEMRDQMYAANFYGPYGIYVNSAYDAYLDNDYARLGGNNANMTLRERILKIGTETPDGTGQGQGQIKFVKRLDNLTPANSTYAFRMVMVSLSGDTMEALNGLPIVVTQYESRGGWMLNFQVYCIQLLRFHADFYGNCGILDARTSS